MLDLLAVAHRGYSEKYPENTRLSYEAAIAAGAHIVETDARLTADGQVVSCHDPDLKRIAGLNQKVCHTLSAQLRALDLGRGYPPTFLHEVLGLARGRAGVLVDIKGIDPELGQAVLEVVAQYGQGVTVYAGVRGLEQLAYMKHRKPDIRYVALLAEYDEIPQWRDQGAYAVRAWEDDVDHPAVAEALKGGGAVWVTAGRRSVGEAPGYITGPPPGGPAKGGGQGRFTKRSQPDHRQGSGIVTSGGP